MKPSPPGCEARESAVVTAGFLILARLRTPIEVAYGPKLNRGSLAVMPPVVTSNATIMCSHGGRVTLMPRQQKVLIEGGAVMCEPDLVGAVIVGCAQPPTPATKPCTTVISTLPGSSAPNVTIDGRPVYVATLTGLTDGVPPSMLVVADPGQALVEA